MAIAEAHGWAADPIECTALATMASADVAQGRFEEALDRARELGLLGPAARSGRQDDH